MKTVLTWQDGMKFEARIDNHLVVMDAKQPIGQYTGATPKALVVMGLGGCTAMDVIALLKKYKQPPKNFNVDVEVQPTSGVQPAVFEKAIITFRAEGEIDANKFIEAVHLSQTKYCGVSAMLAKAFPIEYQIILNQKEVGRGFADFK